MILTGEAIDFTVRTGSAQALDATVRALPGCAAAVVEGSFDGSACVVRVFGNASFFRFAMKNQGYGEILAERSLP
jgi:hypothetical protein